eukprot:9247520-Pyramimonas_sp.AAC.1
MDCGTCLYLVCLFHPRCLCACRVDPLLRRIYFRKTNLSPVLELTGSADKSLRVWDTATRKQLQVSNNPLLCPPWISPTQGPPPHPHDRPSVTNQPRHRQTHEPHHGQNKSRIVAIGRV